MTWADDLNRTFSELRNQVTTSAIDRPWSPTVVRPCQTGPGPSFWYWLEKSPGLNLGRRQIRAAELHHRLHNGQWNDTMMSDDRLKAARELTEWEKGNG